LPFHAGIPNHHALLGEFPKALLVIDARLPSAVNDLSMCRSRLMRQKVAGRVLATRSLTGERINSQFMTALTAEAA